MTEGNGAPENEPDAGHPPSWGTAEPTAASPTAGWARTTAPRSLPAQRARSPTRSRRRRGAQRDRRLRPRTLRALGTRTVAPRRASRPRRRRASRRHGVPGLPAPPRPVPDGGLAPRRSGRPPTPPVALPTAQHLYWHASSARYRRRCAEQATSVVVVRLAGNACGRTPAGPGRSWGPGRIVRRVTGSPSRRRGKPSSCGYDVLPAPWLPRSRWQADAASRYHRVMEGEAPIYNHSPELDEKYETRDYLDDARIEPPPR